MVGSAAFPLTEVRAGRLSARLHGDGVLSDISVDGNPVVQSIAVVVRDDRWGTVPVSVSVAQFVRTDATFRAELTARTLSEDIAFAWHAVVVGSANGAIEFAFDGEALSSLVTNRIGLVVLHPLDLQGSACLIEHPDGSHSTGQFPSLVSPHQLFLNVAAMRHSVAGGSRIRIDFQGDTFETEDQRNWSDASFKTYSRPLSEPFPYTLKEGVRIGQAVTLRASRLPVIVAQGSLPPSEPHGRVAVTNPTREMPPLGFSWSPTSANEDAQEAVAHLSASYVRVDVFADDAGRFGDIARADIASASTLGVPLELALHVPERPATFAQGMLAFLESADVPVAAALIFTSGRPATLRSSFDAIAPLLKEARPQIIIGVGTDDYLAELNRNPIDVRGWGADLVSFSLNPQIHDRRDRAILQTRRAIRAMIETAQHSAGGAPVGVSPLTLTPRRNIYKTGFLPDRRRTDAGAEDSRHHEDLGAAWLLGSVAALLDSHASRITLGELVGSRGFGYRDESGAMCWRPVSEVATALSAAHSFATLDSPDVDAGLVVSNREELDVMLTGSELSSGTVDLAAGGRSQTLELQGYGVAIARFPRSPITLDQS